VSERNLKVPQGERLAPGLGVLIVVEVCPHEGVRFHHHVHVFVVDVDHAVAVRIVLYAV